MAEVSRADRHHGAGDQVVDKLEHSQRREFDGPDDVRKAVSGNG
ncbi:hypothetical protein ACIQ7S_13360 [Streptomyces griseoluteus]